MGFCTQASNINIRPGLCSHTGVITLTAPPQSVHSCWSVRTMGSCCCVVFRESYRSVIGAVVWMVLIRAELTVFVQALQRRAHPFRIEDCKRFSLVTRYMERHKCGLKPVTFKHPFKLVGSIDAAFKAQFE